jgi:hypothetical protein
MQTTSQSLSVPSRHIFVATALIALLALACGGSSGDTGVDRTVPATDRQTPTPDRQGMDLQGMDVLAPTDNVLPPTDTIESPDLPPMGFQVRESVEQLHVTHGMPMAEVVLYDSGDAEVQRGMTDHLGSYLFRKVAPGSGYAVRMTQPMPREVSPLTVLSVPGSQPAQTFYSNQRIVAGFNYITTRDGTTLSAYVTLPGPVEMGPYPTVVNYSGYSPSKPGEPIGDFSSLCGDFPVLCDAPNDGASVMTSSRPSSSSTVTTSSRRSPPSPGCNSTRSAWWGSRILASRRCSWRR